jgi:hypothetical protein
VRIDGIEAPVVDGHRLREGAGLDVDRPEPARDRFVDLADRRFSVREVDDATATNRVGCV